MDGVICLENVCSCKYGAAATAEAFNCMIDGLEICESCYVENSDEYGWAGDGHSVVGIEFNNDLSYYPDETSDNSQYVSDGVFYDQENGYFYEGYFYNPDPEEYWTGHKSKEVSRLGICGNHECDCEDGEDAQGPHECFVGFSNTDMHACHSCDSGYVLTAANLSAYLENPIYPNEDMSYVCTERKEFQEIDMSTWDYHTLGEFSPNRLVPHAQNIMRLGNTLRNQYIIGVPLSNNYVNDPSDSNIQTLENFYFDSDENSYRITGTSEKSSLDLFGWYFSEYFSRSIITDEFEHQIDNTFVKVSFKIKWIDAEFFEEGEQNGWGTDSEDGVNSKGNKPETVHIFERAIFDDGDMHTDTMKFMRHWYNKTTAQLPASEYHEIVFFDSIPDTSNNANIPEENRIDWYRKSQIAGFKLEAKTFDAFVKDFQITIFSTNEIDPVTGEIGEFIFNSHLVNGDGSSNSVAEGTNCVCNNGAARLFECSVGEESCISCDSGYHLNIEDRGLDQFVLDHMVCIPNVCVCPGGTAATAEDRTCLMNGAIMCTACDSGKFAGEDGNQKTPFQSIRFTINEFGVYTVKEEIRNRVAGDFNTPTGSVIVNSGQDILNFIVDGESVKLGVCECISECVPCASEELFLYNGFNYTANMFLDISNPISHSEYVDRMTCDYPYFSPNSHFFLGQ